MAQVETPEMIKAYSTIKPGDPSIFRNRMNWQDPDFLPDYCGATWNDDPTDPPIEGDVWGCTRERGHPPPCVAEGFRQVYAVKQS